MSTLTHQYIFVVLLISCAAQSEQPNVPAVAADGLSSMFKQMLQGMGSDTEQAQSKKQSDVASMGQLLDTLAAPSGESKGPANTADVEGFFSMLNKIDKKDESPQSAKALSLPKTNPLTTPITAKKPAQNELELSNQLHVLQHEAEEKQRAEQRKRVTNAPRVNSK